MFHKQKKLLYRDFIKVKKILEIESNNSKDMVQIYEKYVRRTASREEIKKANKQLVTILKGTFVGFLIVAPLPGAWLLLAVLVKAAEYFDIELLPDSFKLHKN